MSDKKITLENVAQTVKTVNAKELSKFNSKIQESKHECELKTSNLEQRLRVIEDKSKRSENFILGLIIAFSTGAVAFVFSLIKLK